jgi:hypothetical protein
VTSLDESQYEHARAGSVSNSTRPKFERCTERIVIAVGIADPVPATRALMALGDGLLLHRLTVDPELDMRPAIERTVRALAKS